MFTYLQARNKRGFQDITESSGAALLGSDDGNVTGPTNGYSDLHRPHYIKVETDGQAKRHRSILSYTSYLILLAFTAVLSYQLGANQTFNHHIRDHDASRGSYYDDDDVYSQSNLETVIPQVPLNSVTTTYMANESFIQTPQRGQTEPAWDSLLPIGLGYIKYESPTTGTNLSMVSVFHQLHCLYTLRRIVFSNTTVQMLHNSNDESQEDEHGKGGQPSGSNLEDFDFSLNRKAHASHCFEYLRLSLMCNADSRLEPADLSGDEFLGWGVPRQCKNYDQLKNWAEARRAFDAMGFLARGFGS